MLPGVVFFIAMVGYQDQIANVALPSAFLLGKLGDPWFAWAFQLAVLLDARRHRRGDPARDQRARREGLRGAQSPDARAMRPAIAITVMLIAVYAAGAIGLINLIAKGYGYLTYAFIALLILPVLTVGIVRIRQLAPDTPADAAATALP